MSKSRKKTPHEKLVDYIKANRRASRDMEMETSSGFVSTHKISKNKKAYSRKNFKIDYN